VFVEEGTSVSFVVVAVPRVPGYSLFVALLGSEIGRRLPDPSILAESLSAQVALLQIRSIVCVTNLAHACKAVARFEIWLNSLGVG
jgi:hypothetical protein